MSRPSKAVQHLVDRVAWVRFFGTWLAAIDEETELSAGRGK